jgi:peptide deformylase
MARPVDEAMREAGAALLAAASEVHAYGLAAAHLGLDEPVAVVSVAPEAQGRDYRVLYNPQIAWRSPETVFGPEGSVSMPGIEVPVERSTRVEVSFDDMEGQRQVLTLDGFPARVAQHEIDQVNGIFFLSRISRLKRDTALRKFEKSRRG